MATSAHTAVTTLLLLALLAAPVAAWGADPLTWKALTPAEKQVLAPVASRWAQLPRKLRIHLVPAADRFYKMTPTAQARFRRRLMTWAAMSPVQRHVARLNYLKYKALPAQEQQALLKRWMQSNQARIPPAVLPRNGS